MIDVEPRDLGKVVQLVAKTNGWEAAETRFAIKSSILITGNPGTFNQTPPELIQPLRAAWLTTKEKRPTDFNGPKVAVTRLAVVDGILRTEAELTDYFTLWGLPQAPESRPLFEEHERNIVVNRAIVPGDALYQTEIPWGVCTHNILLDGSGDLIFMIRSLSQGFNQGRVSVTEEEQMEPEDRSPFVASRRSFPEELGQAVGETIRRDRIRLLGVAMEKGSAYPAFAFITETGTLPRDIERSWRGARDYNENTSLFVVPMSQIDRWMATDEVAPEVWHPSFLAGNIAEDAKLRLHNTSAWRLELARQYIKAA